MICLFCENEESNLFMGYEISSVYDGISFWECKNCGKVWSRWTEEIVPNWENLSWIERAELANKQKTKKYREVD